MPVTQAPQTLRGRRSRDRIVEAAADTMAERGVEGASCDQILAAAEASKSQMYHYFGSKEELVRAVIARRRDQTITDWMPWLDELDSFAGIRRWFDMLIEQNAAAGCPGCVIGNIAAEVADRDEDAREDLVACFAALEDYLVDGLQRMKDRGELMPRANPERLTNAVWASLQGGLLLAKTTKDPEVLRDALDASYAHLRSLARKR